MNGGAEAFKYASDNFGPMDQNLGQETILTSELTDKTLIDEMLETVLQSGDELIFILQVIV